MKVQTTIVDDQGKMELKVVDHFDVFAFQEFRKAYRSAPPSVTKFDVDLSLMDGFTSAAFGTLLVMFDEVGCSAEINVKNCNDSEFLELLSMSKVDEKVSVVV